MQHHVDRLLHRQDRVTDDLRVHDLDRVVQLVVLAVRLVVLADDVELPQVVLCFDQLRGLEAQEGAESLHRLIHGDQQRVGCGILLTGAQVLATVEVFDGRR